MFSPKIEPEIVFKLKRPLAAGLDPAATLDAVEWLAPGFEIIDCVFPAWRFTPADFVAAYGLHGRNHRIEQRQRHARAHPSQERPARKCLLGDNHRDFLIWKGWLFTTPRMIDEMR